MLTDADTSSSHPKEVVNCLRHIIHGVIYRVEVAPADEARPKKRRELCMTRKAIKAREKRRRLKEAKETENQLYQIHNPLTFSQYLTEDGSNAVQQQGVVEQSNDDNVDLSTKSDVPKDTSHHHILASSEEKYEDTKVNNSPSFYDFLTGADGSNAIQPGVVERNNNINVDPETLPGDTNNTSHLIAYSQQVEPDEVKESPNNMIPNDVSESLEENAIDLHLSSSDMNKSENKEEYNKVLNVDPEKTSIDTFSHFASSRVKYEDNKETQNDHLSNTEI